MKPTTYGLLILLLACQAPARLFAQPAGFPALNTSLLGHWRIPDSLETYSGLCAYAASGREYAIVGTTHGTAFLEVTDPALPRLIRLIPARQPAGLGGRTYQVYQHYAYGVADGQGGHSLQIFDLQYLPDSVRLVADDAALAGARQCFINDDRLYLAASWRDSTSLIYHDVDAFSLQDPTHPTRARSFMARVPFGWSAQSIFTCADSLYLALGEGGVYCYIPTGPAPPTGTPMTPAGPVCTYATGSPSGRRFITVQPSRNDSSLALYEFQFPRPNRLRRPKLMSYFGLPSPASPRAASFLDERYAIVAYQHDGVQVFDLLDPAHPR
ncbi:MAG TPA: hypothetical protein VEI97_18860, partial [bacterium]|nr:hypothetical protein [bacterium]